MDPNAKPPKLFVSYSWTSTEYQQRVVEIAQRLMGDGVHVLLDVWELGPGQDKHKYMEKMVVDPDVKHVLLMCDRVYAQKANARKGGVGTETEIVSSEVYTKVEQKKFIPIVMERNEDGSEPLPAYLASRIYIDFSDDGRFAAEYEKLLRMIFDRPLNKRPEIGKPPAFLNATDAVSSTTRLLQSSRSSSVAVPASTKTTPMKLLRSIVDDFRAQRLMTEPEGEIDEIILSKIQEMKGLRDITIACFRSLMETSGDKEVADELVWFFEQMITLADWPEELNQWSDWRDDHLAFLARELWLYAIAILTEGRRWDAVHALLNTTLCATVNRQFGPVGYRRLECYLRTLDEVHNSKKEQRRISVTADLVKARADDTQIPFELLMQADFVLALRGVVSNQGLNSPFWYPRTLVFKTHLPQPFPLFVRWRAGQHHMGIPALLDVPNRQELATGLLKVDKKVLAHFSFDYWPINVFVLADLVDLVKKERD